MRGFIKAHWHKVVLLMALMVVTAGVTIYLQPRTITTIEPGRVSAFGVIEGLAPGSNVQVYVKANNPHIESNALNIVYVRPQQNYILKRDPFGTEANKIMPPIVYTPAPAEASGWFTITTDNDQAWGIVKLYPYQSKALPFNISIPADAVLPKNWYYIIENRDANESGFIITRNQSLILVNMR